VATSWPSFQSYQQEEAWTWEHLALTRARVITGEVALARDVEAFRERLIAEKGAPKDVLEAVAEMRARVASAKAPAGPWDAKLGPGRLLELELVSQAGNLMAGQAARDVRAGIAGGVAIGWLSDGDGAALSEAYALCWRVQMVARLISDKPLEPERMGEGGAAFLLRETGQEGLVILQERLETLCQRAAQVMDAALMRLPKGR
jgi:glutamate-ammonia-ligase adenylyltransferase